MINLLLSSTLILAPLGTSIVADQVTTYRCLKLNGYEGYSVREGNKLPGMQSQTGRILWNAGEFSAIYFTQRSSSRRVRKVGKIAGITLTILHVSCAIHNEKTRQQILNEQPARRGFFGKVCLIGN